MPLTPNELAELAVTFPEEHAEQIIAKSAKYGLPREDISQDVSLIILERGAEFDPTKGTLRQLFLGIGKNEGGDNWVLTLSPFHSTVTTSLVREHALSLKI